MEFTRDLEATRHGSGVVDVRYSIRLNTVDGTHLERGYDLTASLTDAGFFPGRIRNVDVTPVLRVRGSEIVVHHECPDYMTASQLAALIKDLQIAHHVVDVAPEIFQEMRYAAVSAGRTLCAPDDSYSW